MVQTHAHAKLDSDGIIKLPVYIKHEHIAVVLKTMPGDSASNTKTSFGFHVAPSQSFLNDSANLNI